jgi:hypothetical protein
LGTSSHSAAVSDTHFIPMLASATEHGIRLIPEE